MVQIHLSVLPQAMNYFKNQALWSAKDTPYENQDDPGLNVLVFTWAGRSLDPQIRKSTPLSLKDLNLSNTESISTQ